jgi:anti-sigma regulatory factor (Ser/Thr protein kinase)
VIAGEAAVADVLRTWGAQERPGDALRVLDGVVDGRPLEDDVALLVMRTEAVDRIDRTMPATLLSARRARMSISRALAHSPLGDRADGFVLAMSEAVNNAIEHGSAKPEDGVRISVDWDDDEVRGVVESRGAWAVHKPNLERGRGLTLMRALSDRVEITVGSRGTRVRLFADCALSKGAAYAGK